MRFLGIDYGQKRLGLALSDDKGVFAFPKETIPNDATTEDRIRNIVTREKVTKIIYGDTRAVNGAENPVTKEAEGFMQTLKAHTGVDVEGVWEAWSSVEASRFAPKGKEHDDAAAAAVILQRYLDAHQGG